jgi:AcrR family transcriptional regulator
MPDDLPPTSKTSREDWVNAALTVLVSEGLDQVKILRLAEVLGVARSSFYWFFTDRKALLADLLSLWREKNTGAITSRAARPATSINVAVLNVFECWVDNAVFDARLDFAMRDWARRDADVHAEITAADTARIAALREMFARYGYGSSEAFIRARILYFTQIGYYALVNDEALEERRKYGRDYVLGFTGQMPSDEEMAGFEAVLQKLEGT